MSCQTQAQAGGGVGAGRIEIGIHFHPASHARLQSLPGSTTQQPRDPTVSRNIPVPLTTPLAKVFRAFARDQSLSNPDDWRLIYLPTTHSNPAGNHIIQILSIKIGPLGVRHNDRFAVVHKDDIDALHLPFFPSSAARAPTASSPVIPQHQHQHHHGIPPTSHPFVSSPSLNEIPNEPPPPYRSYTPSPSHAPTHSPAFPTSAPAPVSFTQTPVPASSSTFSTPHPPPSQREPISQSQIQQVHAAASQFAHQGQAQQVSASAPQIAHQAPAQQVPASTPQIAQQGQAQQAPASTPQIAQQGQASQAPASTPQIAHPAQAQQAPASTTQIAHQVEAPTSAINGIPFLPALPADAVVTASEAPAQPQPATTQQAGQTEEQPQTGASEAMPALAGNASGPTQDTAITSQAQVTDIPIASAHVPSASTSTEQAPPQAHAASTIAPSTTGPAESIDRTEFVPPPESAPTAEQAGAESTMEDGPAEVQAAQVPEENQQQQDAAVVVEEEAPISSAEISALVSTAVESESVPAPAPTDAEMAVPVPTADALPPTDVDQQAAAAPTTTGEEAVQGTGMQAEEVAAGGGDVSMQEVEGAGETAPVGEQTEASGDDMAASNPEEVAPMEVVAPPPVVEGVDVEMEDGTGQGESDAPAVPEATGTEAPVGGPSPQEAEGTAYQTPELEPQAVDGGNVIDQPPSNPTEDVAVAPIEPTTSAPPVVSAPAPAPPAAATTETEAEVPPPTDDAFDDILQSVWDSGTGSESWQLAMAGFGESAAASPPPQTGTSSSALPAVSAPVAEVPAVAAEGAGLDVAGATTTTTTVVVEQPVTGVAAPPVAERARVGPVLALPGTRPSGESGKAAPSALPSSTSTNSTSSAPTTTTVVPAPVAVQSTLGGEGVDRMRNMLAATPQKIRERPEFTLPRFKKITAPSKLVPGANAGSSSRTSEGGAIATSSAQDVHAATTRTDTIQPAPQPQTHASRPSAQTARDFFADELLELSADMSTASQAPGAATAESAGGAPQRAMLPPPKKAGPGPASKMSGFKARPKSRGGEGLAPSAVKKVVAERGAMQASQSSAAVPSPVVSPAESLPPPLQPAAQERQMEMIRVKREQQEQAARDEMLLHDYGTQDEHMQDDDRPAPPNGSQARLLHDPKDLLPRRAASRSQTPDDDVKGGKQYNRPRRWWEGEDERGRRSRSPIENRKHPPDVRKQMTREQRELNDLMDGPIDRLPEEGPQRRPRPKYTQDWSSGSGEDTDEGDSADEATLRRREEQLAAKGVGAKLKKKKRRRPAQEGGGAGEGGTSAGRGGSARASQTREKSRPESAEASAAARHPKVEMAGAGSSALATASTSAAVGPTSSTPTAASKAGPSSSKKGKAAVIENAEQAEAKAAAEIESIINQHEYLKLHPQDNRRARTGERKALYDECPRIPKEFIDWREQYALKTVEELDQFISDLLGGNLWHDDKINDRFHFKGTGSKTKLARMLVLLEVCLSTRASLASQLRNRGKGGGRKNIGVAPGGWPITLEHVLDKTMKLRKHLDLTTRDLDDALADAVALKRRDLLDGEPDKELEEKLAVSSSQIRVEPPKATTLQQPPTPPGGWKKQQKKRSTDAVPRSTSASAPKQAEAHDSLATRSHSPSTSMLRNRLQTAKAKAESSSGSVILNHNAELKRKRQAGRALEEADEDSEDHKSGGEDEDERPLARIKTASGSAAAASKKASSSKNGSRRPSGAEGSTNGFGHRNASPGPSSKPMAVGSLSTEVMRQFDERFDERFDLLFRSKFDQHFAEAFGKAWKPAHEVGFNELFPKNIHAHLEAREKDAATAIRRQIRSAVSDSLSDALETLLAEQDRKFTELLETFQADQERKQLAREKYNRRVMKEDMLIELGKELRAQFQGLASGSTNGNGNGNGAAVEEEQQVAEEEAPNVGPSNGPKRRKIKKSATTAARKAAEEAASSSAVRPTTPQAAGRSSKGKESASGGQQHGAEPGSSSTAATAQSSTPFRSPGGTSGQTLEIILPVRPRSMNDLVVQQSSEDEGDDDDDEMGYAEAVAGVEDEEMDSDAAFVDAAMGSQDAGGVERLRDAASALIGAMEGSDDNTHVAVDHAVGRAFGGARGGGGAEGDEEGGGQASSSERSDGEEPSMRRNRGVSETF
ncbi:hypothetical protein A4X09_0g2642 [Tilletia walkeri]|uniref:Uncharacterized protein n=1 Tax=Tilletia walkeri TaxID=117179 RepID=A0A8X7N9I9_9BASI|nr:hypothetical protein A4X09_0g2642 [Tilletia walkeri]